MTAKHTPGPWHAEPQSYDSSSFYIRGSDKDGNRLTWGKGAVAHIPRSTVMPSAANANLIAAAPEMLVALKACAAVCAGETMSKPGLIHALKLAQDAIRKAQGEAP